MESFNNLNTVQEEKSSSYNFTTYIVLGILLLVLITLIFILFRKFYMKKRSPINIFTDSSNQFSVLSE
jgi:hypothetical protein